MIGYLDSETPYTEDGLFKIGEAFVVNGKFLRS
jgi:hypothetical protein